MNLNGIQSSGLSGNTEVTLKQNIALPSQGPPQERKSSEEKKVAPPPEINLEELKKALRAAVKNTRYSYSFHEAMDSVVVKIIDGNTDTVIKEIPAREIQRLHENLQEAIGLLIDEQI